MGDHQTRSPRVRRLGGLLTPGDSSSPSALGPFHLPQRRTQPVSEDGWEQHSWREGSQGMWSQPGARRKPRIQEQQRRPQSREAQGKGWVTKEAGNNKYMRAQGRTAGQNAKGAQE